MKFIIDLIEDIREQIANAEEYSVAAGLLKAEGEKLVYAGEAFLNVFELDNNHKQLKFKIDGSDTKMTIGELIPPLLILDSQP